MWVVGVASRRDCSWRYELSDFEAMVRLRAEFNAEVAAIRREFQDGIVPDLSPVLRAKPTSHKICLTSAHDPKRTPTAQDFRSPNWLLTLMHQGRAIPKAWSVDTSRGCPAIVLASPVKAWPSPQSSTGFPRRGDADSVFAYVFSGTTTEWPFARRSRTISRPVPPVHPNLDPSRSISIFGVSVAVHAVTAF
jgi:hypothetical protein